MALLKLAALGALGYVAYKYIEGQKSASPAAFANDLQRHLAEHTSLGIPAIVHEEICAGLMAREATVFPQAIGVAATFEPELNAELADAVRRQMRSTGAHHGLSPVLDVCRDPRWGRLEETYGELMAWAQSEGLDLAGAMWESYLSDPSAEPDPETWQTAVTWPVE